MGAVGLQARAQLRRAWTSTVVLAVLVAAASGITFAAIAGATTTRDALPHFVEQFKAEDLLVYRMGDLDAQTRMVQEVGEVPGVEAASGDAFVAFAPAASAEGERRGRAEFIAGIAATDGDLFHTLQVPLVVDGRLPDPDAENEVAVNQPFADRRGVGPGDTIDVVAYSPAELEDVANDRPVEPTGPPLSFDVVGIARTPGDISIQGSAGGNEEIMLLTPAFWAAHHDDVANYGVEATVRLEPGVSVDDAQRAIGDQVEDVVIERSQAIVATVDATQRAIDLQADALLAAALAFAAVATVFVGQAVARRMSPTLDDETALRAIGWTSRELAATATVRALPIAVAGALGGVLVAIALSPLTPFGTARAAVADPGVHVDVGVLALGVAVTIVLVLVIAARAGRRSLDHAPQTRRRHKARVANALAAAGAPASVSVAVALPTDHRRRATTVTALLAATLGLAAVTTAVVVRDDLAELITHPDGWGQEWDATVGTYNDPESSGEGIAPLEANPAVAAFTSSSSSDSSGDTVTVDGDVTGAIALEAVQGEPVAPSVVEGTLPAADDEVALGTRTLDAIDKEVGDTVELSTPDGPTVEATVTASVLVPALLMPDARLGDGAVMTPSGLNSLRLGNDFAVTYLVRFADGVSEEAGLASLAPAFGDTVVPATRPADIESLNRVRSLPWIIGALLGGLAALAVANALLLAFRRQRHDLAVLRALGFGRRDLRVVGAVQGALLALVAVAIGLPIGVVVGRQLWRLVDDAIGLDRAPSVPTAIYYLAPLALGLGLALIALPTERAARSRAAEALRVD